jgi:uncharacterized protein YbaA (DUF1428 family)
MSTNYVDGYVLAVPTANREAYRDLAVKMAELFKKHGALSVVECWGDDVPEGKLTSFSMAVQRKEDETVVFSWITWPSRAARDEGIRQVMTHPMMQPGGMSMPFDGQRMIFGGFEVLMQV